MPCQPGGIGGIPGGQPGGGPCHSASGRGMPGGHPGGGGINDSAGGCSASAGSSYWSAGEPSACRWKGSCGSSNSGSIDGVNDCHGGKFICFGELGRSGSTGAGSGSDIS